MTFSNNSFAQTASQGQSAFDKEANGLNIDQLQHAFEQFNRLSENFVHSYQSLEGQVESLADRLAEEVQNKRIQFEEKERMASRLQNLLAILPAGVVVLDGAGRVQDCNAVAIDLLGRPLLGETWLNIIKRSFSPRFDDGYEVSLKDGRRVHIETRALDYEPGQLIVLTDLTETRKLQDKVNQDKRLSSMGRMMASLAHQIRTPLSTALIYAENLTQPSIDATTREKFGSKLADCLQHLERHITDMLQFAKSGGLQLSEVESTILVKKLTQHLLALYPTLAIDVKPIQTCLLNVNSDALFSAIGNLVENAYQSYSNEVNSDVTCEIKVAEGNLNIRVTDQGKGITEEKLEKVFDPFYTTRSGGTGLGLAVVHGVAKAHQGRVEIESKLGQGTQVSIVIPTFECSKSKDLEQEATPL